MRSTELLNSAPSSAASSRRQRQLLYDQSKAKSLLLPPWLCTALLAFSLCLAGLYAALRNPVFPALAAQRESVQVRASKSPCR